MTHETIKLDRRTVIGSAISFGFFAGLAPSVALALTEAASKALVDKIVGEINRVIASGKSESAMIGDFERIFARYADVPIIARSALGADSRRASQAQLRAFSGAFQGYVARKYGKRFREFIGGEIQVQGVRRTKNYHEVEATVFLRGESPFEVLFLVYERGGKNLFFDMVIEGVSMRIVERTEIGSMLDANNGDIDRLINAVQRAG